MEVGYSSLPDLAPSQPSSASRSATIRVTRLGVPAVRPLPFGFGFPGSNMLFSCYCSGVNRPRLSLTGLLPLQLGAAPLRAALLCGCHWRPPAAGMAANSGFGALGAPL